jgi:chorismate mutase
MKEKKTNPTWLNDFQLSHPLVIAGPCSAETESQVLQIARDLQNSKVSIYRAGIWKPRTRPGGFEGVGEIGLQWLQKAKAETGLLMAVEVATVAHVQLALAHDIDVLWIGARTTVNPFAVQEIADALQNTDKIVLVKNPVNPDLSLWIGAVERLRQAGIKKLGVVHRGFSSYEKTNYRNNPEWQIAIDFQSKYPEIPLLIDPSHITGKRDMIFQVTQQALDFNYDGMMIETHCNPDAAWSDAAQQVTPKQLEHILDQLVVRNPDEADGEYQNQLVQLRLKIDHFDAKLLDILGQRMQVAEAIGALKKTKNVAVLQNKRWNDILERMVHEGLQRDLSEAFIVQFFKAIHQESIAHQEKVFKEE